MGCCGEKIKKAVNIVKGHVLFNYETLFGLPAEKYEFAAGRIRICHKCPKQTWMSRGEYVAWLTNNAKEVIANLELLEVLPELPKRERGGRKKLFCMICKCFVPAKAYVKEEKCPLNKWP